MPPRGGLGALPLLFSGEGFPRGDSVPLTLSPPQPVPLMLPCTGRPGASCLVSAFGSRSRGRAQGQGAGRAGFFSGVSLRLAASCFPPVSSHGPRSGYPSWFLIHPNLRREENIQSRPPPAVLFHSEKNLERSQRERKPTQRAKVQTTPGLSWESCAQEESRMRYLNRWKEKIHPPRILYLMTLY